MNSKMWTTIMSLGILVIGLSACGGDSADDQTETQATSTETPDAAQTTVPDATEAPATECDELTPVRLAVPAPSLNFVAYYLGAEEGIFEEHCVDLNIEVVRGDAAVAALLSDEIDFTAAGGTAMRAALEGAPVRAVMVTVGESTASLVVQPEIEETADITGSDIAVLGTGDSLAVALNQWLRSEGIDPETDINLLTVNSTPDAFSSLVGGSVDGAMLTPPFDAQAEAEGMHVLVDVSEFFAGSQAQVATSTEKIEQESEMVKRFLSGAVASINHMVDNPDVTSEFIIEFLELEEELANRAVERFLPNMALDGRVDDEALLSQLPEGSTEEDLEAVTDFSLLEEVLSERG